MPPGRGKERLLTKPDGNTLSYKDELRAKSGKKSFKRVITSLLEYHYYGRTPGGELWVHQRLEKKFNAGGVQRSLSGKNWFLMDWPAKPPKFEAVGVKSNEKLFDRVVRDDKTRLQLFLHVKKRGLFFKKTEKRSRGRRE